MQDLVKFGDMEFKVPTGHTEQEIREALEESVPAIVHARGTRVANGDGSSTWTFTEVAGTKGC